MESAKLANLEREKKILEQDTENVKALVIQVDVHEIGALQKILDEQA